MADPTLPTRDDVERARATIGGTLHRTPLLSSGTLKARLKCELFQRTGSFKSRGALNRMRNLTVEEKRAGVIAISAGNHAQAVAWAAAAEEVDALVVMWQGASEQKLAATRGYGATVDLEAADPTEAFARVAELREQTGRAMVHPHDDAFVVAGAGTLALEIEEDAPDADVVILAVGGGGLFAGVQTALAGTGRRVVAVEPELSQALHEGLRRGQPTPVLPTSIADGLNAPFVGRVPLALAIEHQTETVLVSEDEIHDAFRFLYARTKLACEPAAAAAAAAWLSGRIQAENPVIVLSGGNVAASTAAAILAAR